MSHLKVKGGSHVATYLMINLKRNQKTTSFRQSPYLFQFRGHSTGQDNLVFSIAIQPAANTWGFLSPFTRC